MSRKGGNKAEIDTDLTDAETPLEYPEPRLNDPSKGPYYVDMEAQSDKNRSAPTRPNHEKRQSVQLNKSLQQFFVPDRIWTCNHEGCTESFCTRHDRDVHRHTYLPDEERPYKCHCGLEFSVMAKLNSHIQEYHEKKIVADCPRCGKEFVRKRGMELRLGRCKA
jgi:hypothetical protein